MESLEACLSLTLTSKVYAEVQGTIKYCKSFECILMSCIWDEILNLVDTCNQIIQQRDTNLDAEVSNIKGLAKNLDLLKVKWPKILEEAQAIAESMQVEAQLSPKRTTSHLTDEERLDQFKTLVFDKIVGSVQEGMEKCFQALEKL